MDLSQERTGQQITPADKPPIKWPIIADYVDPVIMNIPGLHEQSVAVKNRIHEAVLQGGTPTRIMADLLHGVFIGHPLHPILTDVTIGAWLFGGVFDWVSILRPNKVSQQAADTLTLIGTLSAVPTAMAGIADYSTIKEDDSAAYGAAHGILNSIGLTLYVASLAARRSGNRPLAIFFSTLALLVLTPSAWIGGDMVYRLRVGANHADAAAKPQAWTRVMQVADLPDLTPQRIEVEGNPVLLYKRDGEIYAIGAVCAHAGGPLDEGEFEGVCVQCPWHDSVYDLRDGKVVHGPTTYAVPQYEVRIIDGQIALRAGQESAAFIEK